MQRRQYRKTGNLEYLVHAFLNRRAADEILWTLARPSRDRGKGRFHLPMSPFCFRINVTLWSVYIPYLQLLTRKSVSECVECLRIIIFLVPIMYLTDIFSWKERIVLRYNYTYSSDRRSFGYVMCRCLWRTFFVMLAFLTKKLHYLVGEIIFPLCHYIKIEIVCVLFLKIRIRNGVFLRDGIQVDDSDTLCVSVSGELSSACLYI